MLNRILGVLRLDVNTFEEVEADEGATGQAAIIVALAAIFNAIAGYVSAVNMQASAQQFGQEFSGDLGEFGALADAFSSGLNPTASAISGFITVFITWGLWSVLTYFIGTKLFGGKSTIGQMLRVIGFAQAPYLFLILGAVPCLGGIVACVVWIWGLVTSFVGVRQGLDLDNGKTAVTVVLSFIVVLIVNIFLVLPVLGMIV